MASIRKRGTTYTAEVRRQGIYLSDTFTTKAAAQAWATKAEADILAGKRGQVGDKTFADLLDEYARRVSPTKKGGRWESIRIELFKRDQVASINLRDLTPAAFADWRDRRLQSVSAASVRREWVLMSHALNIAMKEWCWIHSNPMKDVRRPAPPEARDRRISQDEIDRLLHVLGNNKGTSTWRVGQAFLFAVETALRAGEICALNWSDIHIDKRFCSIRSGKTAAASRDVALSQSAIEILLGIGTTEGSAFCLKTSQIDALFRKAKAKAAVDDLHFHDSRHEAITRLSRKLDVLALARMVGHRDLKMLQVYYNESAEDIAARL